MPNKDFIGPMGGPGYISGSAASVNIHKNYNGSGPSAFGGAKEWPHITVRVAFPSDTQAEHVAAVADKFSAVLLAEGYTPE